MSCCEDETCRCEFDECYCEEVMPCEGWGEDEDIASGR